MAKKTMNASHIEFTETIPAIDSIACDLRQTLAQDAHRLKIESQGRSLTQQERKGLLDLTKALTGLSDLEDKAKREDAILQLNDTELFALLAKVFQEQPDLAKRLLTGETDNGNRTDMDP